MCGSDDMLSQLDKAGWIRKNQRWDVIISCQSPTGRKKEGGMWPVGYMGCRDEKRVACVWKSSDAIEILQLVIPGHAPKLDTTIHELAGILTLLTCAGIRHQDITATVNK